MGGNGGEGRRGEVKGEIGGEGEGGKRGKGFDQREYDDKEG